MCGRYALIASPLSIREHYALQDEISFKPRYNIAPSQQILTVRRDYDSPKWIIEERRWGLIPPWAKDKKIGYKMVNAMAETIATKPAYRSAFKARRCLIPASGFYEWAQGPDRKQPYYIQIQGTDLFSFAGIFERWGGDEDIESCAIITTDPSETVKPIHNRMPVILSPDNYAEWLDPKSSERILKSLMGPYPAKMIVYPVSTLVNKPTNDSVDCIAGLP
jgi:putative SOS response-associated peptidase YedK